MNKLSDTFNNIVQSIRYAMDNNIITAIGEKSETSVRSVAMDNDEKMLRYLCVGSGLSQELQLCGTQDNSTSKTHGPWRARVFEFDAK